MNPITPLGLKWELRHSFWMIFLLMPFTAPLSYIYIGIRARQLWWVTLGVLYFIIINGLSIVLWNISLDHGMSGLIVPAILICWLNALFSGRQVRVYYLTLLYDRMDTETRELLSAKERKRQQDKLQALREKRSPKMLSKKEMFDKQSERVHFIVKRKRQNEQPKIININVATVHDISQLPGIGMIVARKIVSIREQGNQFKSMTHLISLTQIQREVMEKASNYIAFSDDEVKQMQIKYEQQQKRKSKSIGRKVDY